MTKSRVTVLRVLTALVFAGVVGSASAQTYPTKPVRIIVPFPPGASNDILARIVGAKLGEAFRMQTIVDNRPGGSTIIGASTVAKSPPDGYTLLVTSSTHLITTLLIPAP